MATHKQKFLQQAHDWIGAREAGGQNRYEKKTKLAAIFAAAGGYKQGTAWCAIFVSACATRAKAHRVIGTHAGAGGICQTVLNKGGTWIPGPYRTKSKVKPQPGDLILYNNSDYHVRYKEDGSVRGSLHGNHVGIVYKVTSTRVFSIEGNLKGGKCDIVKHKLNARKIGGYARPKWSKIDKGSADEDPLEAYDGPLYAIENDRHDMTMREIGYMNTSTGKLTKTATKVPIALINYTTLMGDLYDMFERNTYTGTTVSTKKLSGNEKIVVDTLMDLGMSASVACGIAGNIKVDSNYNPAASKDGGVGLALWKGTDATQMKDVVGWTGWLTDLSGQVEYIYDDIANEYPELSLDLSGTDNSVTATENAAIKYANVYRGTTNTKSRVDAAKAIYAKVVITPPKQSGTTSNPTVKKSTDNKTTKDKVIDTSKKTQKSLSVCYEYYNGAKCDKKIRDEWVKLGSPTTKGLAYINGNYLVAINSNMGCKMNDVIDLHLSNGSVVPCLVAGTNTYDKTFLQFYQAPEAKVNLLGWYEVTIKKIVNHGQRKK